MVRIYTSWLSILQNHWFIFPCAIVRHIWGSPLWEVSRRLPDFSSNHPTAIDRNQACENHVLHAAGEPKEKCLMCHSTDVKGEQMLKTGLLTCNHHLACLLPTAAQRRFYHATFLATLHVCKNKPSDVGNLFLPLVGRNFHGLFERKVNSPSDQAVTRILCFQMEHRQAKGWPSHQIVS